MQLQRTLNLQDILLLLNRIIGWAYVHEVDVLGVLHARGLVGQLRIQRLRLLLSHVHLEVLLDFLVVLLQNLT